MLRQILSTHQEKWLSSRAPVVQRKRFHPLAVRHANARTRRQAQYESAARHTPPELCYGSSWSLMYGLFALLLTPRSQRQPVHVPSGAPVGPELSNYTTVAGAGKLLVG